MNSPAIQNSTAVAESSRRRIEFWLQRYSWMILVVLLATLFAGALMKDVKEPMWTDELLTLHMAQERNINDIVTAILDGVDAQPPLYDLIVRWTSRLIPNDSLRVRLPATIGYFCMGISIFLFARKRVPSVYAIIAVLLAMLLTWPYASEGRSYGAVLGCVGIALVCWQHADHEKTRKWALPLLAISISSGIAFQYFTIFVVCALIAAELARSWMSRKVNWGVYSAIFISLLVLIPHLPLIRAGRTFLKHFWSKVYLETTYEFYLAVLIALIPFLLFVIPASCWVAIVCARSPFRASLPPAEWISIVGISILPEIVICGSLLTVRVFVYRYMLWSMIGIALAISVLLGKWSRGCLKHGLVCCVPLVTWCYYTSYHAYFDRPEFRYSQGLEQQLSRFPQTEITFASVHPFMELMHYGNPALRDRLIFVIDNDLEIHYKDTNTTFLILTALRRRNSTNVLDFQEFCRTHSKFMLVDDDAGWLSMHLRHLGFSFLAQGGTETQRIYDVTAPTGLNCATAIDTARSLLSSSR